MDFIADSQSSLDKIPAAKILVVDDDTLNQRMMQVLLSRDGHEVEVVSSGLEAIEAIKLKQYDIVFMDLQMPVMDGVETSRRIREWENGGQHTFIVALTASYLPEKGQELFEAGIDNYVSKPFELDHIQRLLKYSRVPASTRVDQSVRTEEEARPETVLDIQKGIERVGGNAAMYRELLSDFIQELPDRLRQIQDCFERKDLTKLAGAAHNLQGVAANLGAWRLSAYAQRLDKETVEGYTEALDHLIGEIRLTGNKLIETSHDFLADGNFRVRIVE